MAMEKDEDTVMGEVGSHQHPTAPHHLAADGTNRQSIPPHLNGGSDPSLAPPILDQSMRFPLPPRPAAGPAHGPVPVSAPPGGDSPAKSLAKPFGLGKTIGEPVERPESPIEENSDWSDEDVTSRPGIPLASLSSGLCYDVQMRYHCEVRPTADVHPEDPRRIYYIYKELCRAGLVDDPESSRPLVSQPLKRINARNAMEEEISLVHTPDHFWFVESTKGNIFRLL